ncbi:hypothetical protein L914_18434 [Phytophthora nicotianae]|uniref:Uncharacterized protein n=1 Tax=Phytophthora nicotianae TaxID=4792 RepID=W2MDP1_PHYNI|nr:hypothetical protein L914_18434 [Phytophthora nicotianae]
MEKLQVARGPWKKDFDGALEAAAIKGHLDIVKWLYERGIELNTLWEMVESISYIERSLLYVLCSWNTLELAAEHGHLEVVQWVYTTKAEKNKKVKLHASKAMDLAVANGHIVIAQWLHTVAVQSCGAWAADTAAKNGHLEMLQWLQSTRLLNCTTAAMDGAAENGHLEILTWLHRTRDDSCSSTALECAANNGHLEVYRGERCTDMRPASYGNLEVVKWFHVHYPNLFTPNVMEAAAESGQLHIVRWLHENRGEGCTTLTMDVAARNGHLDVVLYLLEHKGEDFPSYATTSVQNIEVQCLFATSDTLLQKHQRSHVSDDQLITLQSAYERRPAFVKGCLSRLAGFAVRVGNIELLDWLNQLGLELHTTVPIRNAVSQGNVKLLEWFHWNQFELNDPDLLQLAVQEKQLDAARWLSKHGFKITSLSLLEEAGRKRAVPMMRWLVEHGPPLNFETAMKLTMEYRQVEIALWVSETDRVQIVIEALQDKSIQNEVAWILTRTRFEDPSSKRRICDAIQHAPESTALWFEDHLSDFEECKWIFPSRKRRHSEMESMP